jgi:signal transduction histidine kinase
MGKNLRTSPPGLMAQLRHAALRAFGRSRPAPGARAAPGAPAMQAAPGARPQATTQATAPASRFPSIQFPASRLPGDAQPSGHHPASGYYPSGFEPSVLPGQAPQRGHAPGPHSRQAPLDAAAAGPQPAASTLRSRVLLPLAAAVLLMVSTFVAIFVFESRARQADDIARTAASLEATLRDESMEGVQVMRSLMELIMENPQLARAMRNRDRRTLLDHSAPLLQRLRTANHITHLYYIQPDLTALLRVHAPQSHGDRIERTVLLEAQRSGKPAWGNEQGPMGTFTLRVVHPWFVQGELIGYLEMGIEFEDLTLGIRSLLGVDAYVAIGKKYFDRQKWEQAQKQKDPPVDWDEFSTVVVLSRTTDVVPPPVAAHLEGLQGRHVKESFEVDWNDRVAQAIVLPFANLRGETLGELVVLRDITAAATQRRHAVAGVAVLGTLVGGILMVLFHVLIGRAQREAAARAAHLAEAQRVLTAEQMQRQRTQRELAMQRERNELLENRHHMFQDLLQAKRALESRTEELAHSLALLNATLDAAPDGILAPTFADGTVRANAQLAQMWGLPQEMLARGVDAELFAFMARQVKRPDRFIAEVEDMYACPEAEAFDVMELRDGRTFERHVKPQRLGGKTVGIVINFRDVTDRRRVEAQLQNVQRELVAGSRLSGPAALPAPPATQPATSPTAPLPLSASTRPLQEVAGVLDRLEASAGTIETRMRSSEAMELARAVRLMREHAEGLADFLTTDPQGRQLPAYLDELTRALEMTRSTALRELGTLTRGMQRIREIVTSRASRPAPAGVVELMQLSDLLDDALRVNGAALARHHVTVVKDLAEVPALPLDRHRLLLVMVNLIRHARHAVQAAPLQAPCITLRTELVDGRRLRIEVQDNGAGLAPQDLGRLFAPDTGSGTPSPGRSFGLHACALAAGEMGGTLSARSEGLGRGATLTLELPADALETVG